MFRPRFDSRIHIGRPMVAATEFLYDGVEYEAGDSFPVDDIHPRKVAAMYGARRINFAPEQTAEAETADTGPATIEAQPGGYYLVSAPWLDEPERIRGKAKAEARAAEINEGGEPETHHGYTLAEGENGWWKITRADDPADEPVALNVQGEDNARQAVATLRAGEELADTALPAEWAPQEPLKAGDVVLVAEDAEGDLAGLTATVDAIDGDQATLKAFVGEGDEAQLVEGTVPVEQLTIAPAEGDGDEDQAEGGETTPAGGNSEGGENADASDDQTAPADGDQTSKENDDGKEQDA